MKGGSPLVAVLAVVVAVSASVADTAGAPRKGGKFVNPADPLERGGISVAAPFLLRRAWTSLWPRSGGAKLVPFNRRLIRSNPSITWIGHATMLVRMDGVTFLTDPMFSERASPVSFVGPKRLVPPGVPLDELPNIDFVTLSHDHYDHTDLPSIEALAKKGARFIVPLGIGELVRGAGGKAIELDWWQSTEVKDVRIHCVPAQHFSGRGITDHGKRLWAGWLVEGPTRRFYHAGDTGYFDGFRKIGEKFGPIHLAAVPIGAYLPAEMMQPVHLNPEEAIRAGRDVRAERVVGMHWGTFDLTDEELDEPPRRFRAEAGRLGYPEETVWVMNVGETRLW